MSSDTPLSPTVKRGTRNKANGRNCPANAARASAAAGPEPAMSPTVLRHNPAAENAAAAALQAADAAAADAECDDPRVLRAVLLAAAATANALAQTGAQDTVQAHRRGGRPPPTRRANLKARPQNPEAHRHTSAKSRRQSHSQAAKQSRQHDPATANKPPQGQDKPVRSQEHHPPPAATAPLPPLCLRPAKSRP
jgi:hypothetical protein